MKGGPLMFVLLSVSIVGIAIVIGKYRQIFTVNTLHKKLAAKIAVSDSLDSIMNSVNTIDVECPLSIVLKKAISMRSEDYFVVKDSIETAANMSIHKLEKGLGWISTIAAVAPLIGFLGTVTGMVKVFINIAAHSQQGIDITLLASGIWEALLTTVGGLVVGIPAIIFYNDLVSHTENNAKLLQEQIDDFMIRVYKKS